MVSSRPKLPGEPWANMQTIDILADEVLEVSGPMQSQEGQVSETGAGIFKSGIKVRRLALFFQRPHTPGSSWRKYMKKALERLERGSNSRWRKTCLCLVTEFVMNSWVITDQRWEMWRKRKSRQKNILDRKYWICCPDRIQFVLFISCF